MKGIMFSVGSLSSIFDIDTVHIFGNCEVSRHHRKTAVKSHKFVAKLASVAFGSFYAGFGALHLNQ